MAYDRIPIGRFSFITRLSQKALRLYDTRGILVPEIKEPFTGYRYYTGTQIARGVLIKTLCGLGFSLSDIAILIAAKDSHDSDTIRSLFDNRRRGIRSEVHRLQQIEAILKNENASLELLYMSRNEPCVKEIPAQRIVGKRGQGSYSETITLLMGDLCSQIFSPENQRNGLKVVGPFMTLYYDSDYREKDATMECASPITGRISLTDPALEVRTLPGGSVLSLLSRGPYSGLHGAWTRIGAYAEEHGYIANGLHREVYLSDPNEVAEEELLTELQIPVETPSP